MQKRFANVKLVILGFAICICAVLSMIIMKVLSLNESTTANALIVMSKIQEPLAILIGSIGLFLVWIGITDNKKHRLYMGIASAIAFVCSLLGILFSF
jgi:hypothetical protein